jgi:hypothetical protein
MVDELDKAFLIVQDYSVSARKKWLTFSMPFFYGTHELNAKFAFRSGRELNSNEQIIYFDPNSATCKV